MINTAKRPPDEESFAVLKRRGGLQADVSGVEEYQQVVDDADQKLERGDEPIRYTVREASPDGRSQLKLSYTESCLGPRWSVGREGQRTAESEKDG